MLLWFRHTTVLLQRTYEEEAATAFALCKAGQKLVEKASSSAAAAAATKKKGDDKPLAVVVGVRHPRREHM